MIVLIVDIMDGTPGNLNAKINGSLVHTQSVHPFATERRDERWVDIDHTVHKVSRDEQMLQIPTHDHQFRPRFADRVKHRLGVSLAICKIFFPDEPRRDERFFGEL